MHGKSAVLSWQAPNARGDRACNLRRSGQWRQHTSPQPPRRSLLFEMLEDIEADSMLLDLFLSKVACDDVRQEVCLNTARGTNAGPVARDGASQVIAGSCEANRSATDSSTLALGKEHLQDQYRAT